MIIGVGSLAIPLLAAGFWLYGAWKSGEESISEELVKFDRLRSVAAYEQVLGNAGADDKAYGGLFFKGGPAAIVSADLLTLLKQMAAARGIEVVRTGDLQPKTEGPITLLGGSLEMSGTIPAIYGLIQQIEADKPLLFIDHLAVRSNGTEDKNDTLLTAEMQVYGVVHSSKLSENGTGN